MISDTHTATGTATINNQAEWPCEFVISDRTDYVWSSTATKPDPRWEFIDTAGHFHTFTKDGDLPTLNSEGVRMPCDGSCGGTCNGEGYTVTRWTCRICGQEVEPGYVPDEGARTMGVPVPLGTSAKVTVTSREPVAERGREVSIRIRSGEVELFGTGFIGAVKMSGGPTGVRVESEVSCRFLEERLKA